ncbi:t-SNARE [Obelidium mucronatum]|nr:t-SNARE [Obelidium mucronatum]
MATFNRQSQAIEGYLTRIENGIYHLKQFLKALQNETDIAKVENITNGMNSIRSEVECLTSFSRDGLKMLLQSQRGDKIERKRVHQNLLARLRSLTQSYMDVQKETQTFTKTEFARQYRIVNPEATETEIENAIQLGQTSVFSDALTANRQILREVESRQNELVTLLQSLNELASIMTELHALINSQQEMIDVTESNVGNAVDYMEKGIHEVHIATGHAANARATQWKIFAVVSILVLILIIFIVYEVMKNKQ